MSAIKTAFCAAVSSLSLAACSTTDSWDPSQRNAAIGGLIGGALGAAIGYYTGCREQGGCFVGGKQVANRNDLQYDRNDRRYYYVDRSTGRTYWDNGDFRG
jgi:hypothetical protein